MDTMTLTKGVGAFCGALLVFLLGGWIGESIYHKGGGHGDHHEQAYVIDTGEDHGDADEEVVEVSFDEVYAAADASAGERVFNKCKSCHKMGDGENGTGPHLFNIVGREIAVVDGFGYSGALAEAGDVWSLANLDAFLENPKGWAPGTKMSFNGLAKIEDRANLIAYLETYSN